jgi:hypothetical protein
MTLLGKILAVLNALAAIAFGVVAYLDYDRRQNLEFATYAHQRAATGLPVAEESPPAALPPERYQARKPDAEDSEALKSQFLMAGAPGKPVNVQQKELQEVRSQFLGAINDAARQVVQESRNKEKDLRSILLSLAANGDQFAKLSKRIDDAKRANKMDELLEEAARRQMLAQVLLPLEELRPEGFREQLAALIGDLDKPSKDLEDRLGQEIDQLASQTEQYKKAHEEEKASSEPDSFGLRKAVAYLLFSMSQVVRPDNGSPLNAPPDARVEVVVGRQQFNHAMDLQAKLFRAAADRRLAEIESDLENFAQKYNREIKDHLPTLMAAIKRHEAALKDWEEQKARHAKQYEDREEHYKQVLKKFNEARAKATAALADLAHVQQQLYQAQLMGAGVSEENQRLEKDIRNLERRQ